MSKLSPPMIAALALAGLLLVGMGIAGIVVGTGTSQADSSTSSAEVGSPGVNATGPVAVVPVDAPDAGSASCTTLLADLPASLTNAKNPVLRRRTLVAPAPVGAAAWGGTSTQDPVVLRCGLPRPDELTPTAELFAVDGVNWLEVNGDDAATWYVVDRPVYVALTVPGGLSSGPIQEVSAAISKALPAVTIRVNG